MSEFNEKREKLAQFMLELYYGEGAWETAGSMQDNYRYDAKMALLTLPHLLSLQERVRLWREEREFVAQSLDENGDAYMIEDWQEFHDTFQEDFEDSIRATAAYHSILSALPE